MTVLRFIGAAILVGSAFVVAIIVTIIINIIEKLIWRD